MTTKKQKTVRLDAFTENPDNPQTVTDDAFALLVDSLRNTPETLAVSKIAYVTDYVALDGTDMRGQRVVIAGNKRLRALKQIASQGGLASDDGETWHVTPRGDVPADWFYDLTPLGRAAREAWLVKSNIQSGEWDAEKLLALYPQEDLAALMGDDAVAELCQQAEVAETSAEGQTDADAVPDAPTAPVSKRGEVYQLGEHRLMCGDATDSIDCARLMGGGGC